MRGGRIARRAQRALGRGAAKPRVRRELVGHDPQHAVRLYGHQADRQQARHITFPWTFVL